MGNKMSMVALDKYEKRLSVDVRVFVKYEKRAADAGISVAAVMNAVLDDAVAKDPWTREDEARARALIDQNFEKRERTTKTLAASRAARNKTKGKRQ